MAMIGDRVRMKVGRKTGTIRPLPVSGNEARFAVMYDGESVERQNWGDAAEVGATLSKDDFEVIEPGDGITIWLAESRHSAEVDPYLWEGCEILAHNTRYTHYVRTLFRADQRVAHGLALQPPLRIEPAPHGHYISDDGKTVYVRDGKIQN